MVSDRLSRAIHALVQRMARARDGRRKTYMPTALLCVTDLAEQGRVHDGVLRAEDYAVAWKRIMVDVHAECEDRWFRPMLHVKEHGMWRPYRDEREVPFDSRRVSRLDERRAKKYADELRLDPLLAEAIATDAGRDLVRRLVYAVLDDDREAGSSRLAAVHHHLVTTGHESESLQALLEYETRQEERSAFDDLRVYREARRVVRFGQPRFRGVLLQAYGGRCCISRADAPTALEAAHIVPFLGRHSNQVTNGLLLRADLHTLFDEGLVTIDERTVQLHRNLRGTVYEEFAHRPMQVPTNPELQPNDAYLAWHRRKNTA